MSRSLVGLFALIIVAGFAGCAATSQPALAYKAAYAAHAERPA